MNGPRTTGVGDGPLVVLGGTFDPPHVGHLIVADDLFYILRPAAVMFIPAAIQPHKQSRRHAPPGDRWEMVRRAVAADGRFTASPMEVERGGVSYTVDTVAALRAQGWQDIIVAVGADNLAEIIAWKDWERLVSDVRLVVFSRAGYEDAAPPSAVAGKFERVDVTPVPISATMVRERIKAGKPYRYLVPPAVYEYIEASGIYR